MQKGGKFWLIFLALAALLLVLTVACEEEGEEERTPTDTPAATVTGTPAAVETGTPTPVSEVPGITDTEIILGEHAVLSGMLSTFLAPIAEAEEAYFRYVNETEGGVCGRKIVLKVEDNEYDEAKTVEVVRKLVEQDQVFAMVGNMGSPHAAAWDYLNEKGVPDLFISAGDHIFGVDPQGHPWSIQMIPDYRMEGALFGRYISENLPGEKVAVLYPRTGLGLDGLAGVKDGLDTEKNQIVTEQSFEITDVDIRSQVIAMENANAEVVVLYSTGGFTAQAIKAADRMDWHPQYFVSYPNSDDSIFQFVLPELMKGTITFQALKLASWTDDPAIAQHHELMRTYDGPTPANFTIYGQALAELTVEVLTRSCDNLSREGVMDAVLSLRDWHSDLLMEDVNVSFSDTDRTALQSGAMLQAIVENGKGKWEYLGAVVPLE
ncbi:MAG: ABC transporter substrate-binding protein [Dehalococcoidia bacterium]|nr:MAG: ABC transporter substrate-binding protein [Dehalococcoidia bacterium]